jgi:hypothetical protein
MTTYLEKEMKSAGYEIEIPVEGLLVVKNFVSDEEIKEYFGIINNSTQKDWEIQYTQGLKKFCMAKFGRDDVEKLVEEGLFEITQNWHDKNLGFDDHPINHKITSRLQNIIDQSGENLIVSGFYFFQRMPQGVELVAHTDQHTDPSIQYAAIIYIHDNYKDGEVFWSNKGIQMVPKPGTLVMFPGNDEFNHGVRPVGEGPIRYVLPAFIKIPKFYDNNKYGIPTGYN